MTLTCSAVDSLLPLAHARPAFRDDALRMLGACLRHPVTRAIQDNALRFDPPGWPAGHEALSRLATRLSSTLIRVLTERSLPFEPAPSWNHARPALDRVFGIGLAHHFLHAAPLEWLLDARLTEPQITKGFAHLLNSGDRTIQTGRIRALLRALGSDPGDADSSLREAGVTPEASTAEGKRIDLLIEWRDASCRKRGAVIEAKFGHEVTGGQLPGYRAHLECIEKDYRREVRRNERERPLIFIVSPLRDGKVTRALDEPSEKDWRWISWRSLLLAYDRNLDPDHDDDAFRQFRRTLWDRAG